MDDKPLFIVEKHWIVHIKHLFSFLFYSVLSFIMLGGAYFVIKVFGVFFENVDKIMYISIICYQLFITWIYLMRWIDDKLDILIVSKYRIKSIEQKGLFKKSISEIMISSISDVKMESTVLGNFLKFGNLKIHLESDEVIEMNYVSNVSDIQKKILDLVQSFNSDDKEEKATKNDDKIDNQENLVKLERFFKIQSLPKNRHLPFKKQTFEINYDTDIQQIVLSNNNDEDVKNINKNDLIEKKQENKAKKDIKMVVDLRTIKDK